MATPSPAPAAASGSDQQAVGGTSSSQDRPVEMADLPPSARQAQSSQADSSSIPPHSSSAAPQPETSPQNQPDEPVPTASSDPSAPTQPSDASTGAQGIAPAESAAPQSTAAAPAVAITLLLTNGARHPYKIDDKYLKKRNVTADDDDPFNISVYTLKELIWRDWREEWENKPTSPGSIRLIHFGRMLDDKSPLKECRFQAESPNVVHMTVKPQEIVDEEEQNSKGGKGGRGDRDGEERTAGCRCIIL